MNKKLEERFNKKFPQFRDYPEYFKSPEPRRDKVLAFLESELKAERERIKDKIIAWAIKAEENAEFYPIYDLKKLILELNKGE